MVGMKGQRRCGVKGQRRCCRDGFDEMGGEDGSSYHGQMVLGKHGGKLMEESFKCFVVLRIRLCS